jgi:hypothetical protein
MTVKCPKCSVANTLPEGVSRDNSACWKCYGSLTEAEEERMKLLRQEIKERKDEQAKKHQID